MWRQGRSTDITRTALVFEGSLGVLALLLGWTLGFSPLRSLSLDAGWMHAARGAGWGLLGTLPLLPLLLVLERYPVGPLEPIRRFVEEVIVPLFQDVSPGKLAGISLAAGVGEELLFRGLLQDGLASWIGPPHGVWIGLAVASVLFGLAHCVTWGYAVLAALIGVYFGLLLLAANNLLAPLTAHAVYDFVALVYLTRRTVIPGGQVHVFGQRAFAWWCLLAEKCTRPRRVNDYRRTRHKKRRSDPGEGSDRP